LDGANAARRGAARLARLAALEAGETVRRKPVKSGDGIDAEFRRAMRATIALVPVRKLIKLGVSERSAAGLIHHDLVEAFLPLLGPETLPEEAAALALQLLAENGYDPTADDGAASVRKAIQRDRQNVAPMQAAARARQERDAAAVLRAKYDGACEALLRAYDAWFHDTPAGLRGGLLTRPR